MSQWPGEGVRYMNRATCGLQNSDSPTSNNLTPQETTEQESGTVGADGVTDEIGKTDNGLHGISGE